MKKNKLLFCWMLGLLCAITQGQDNRMQRMQENLRTDQARQMDTDTLIRGNAGNSSIETARLRSLAWQTIQRDYRKTKDSDLTRLMPDEADVTRYADVLRLPNTGLIKLSPQAKCAVSPNVVGSTIDCRNYALPGAGASYSFRAQDYRLARLADITFDNNSFLVTGALTHGILVKLGDLPLEKVDLQTPGLNYLVEFKPDTDRQQAAEAELRLAKGIQKDGFLYGRGMRVRDDAVYALRSIAYRGNYLRVVQGFTFNELDYDKRYDVLVVFRIVRRHDDGSVTVLWRRLAKQDSPMLSSNGK